MFFPNRIKQMHGEDRSAYFCGNTQGGDKYACGGCEASAGDIIDTAR
jgi:hypothetical protein